MAIIRKTPPNPTVTVGRTAVKRPTAIGTSTTPQLAKTVNDLSKATVNAVNKLSAQIVNAQAAASSNPVIPDPLDINNLNVADTATIKDLVVTGTTTGVTVPGVADGWAYVTCSGPTITAGLNATGVSKTSTGIYVVSFSTLATNPIIVITVLEAAIQPTIGYYQFAPGAVTVHLYNVSSAGLFDPTAFSIVIYG